MRQIRLHSQRLRQVSGAALDGSISALLGFA